MIEDYRKSHTAPEKGATYASSFQKNNNLRFTWEWERTTLDRIFDDMGFTPTSKGGDYLDFACGTGRILGHLEDRFERPVGVDVSESMLSQAREAVQVAELKSADLTSEKIFGERNFDVVSAFRFFVNAQSELREAVMKELSSLLADDGRLVFNVHVNRNSLFSRVMLLYKWLKRDRSGEFRTMSLGEAKDLLEKNGLTVEKAYHRGVIPIFNDTSEAPPFSLLRPIENLFSRLGLFRGISRYVIFVCRKT